MAAPSGGDDWRESRGPTPAGSGSSEATCGGPSVHPAGAGVSGDKAWAELTMSQIQDRVDEALRQLTTTGFDVEHIVNTNHMLIAENSQLQEAIESWKEVQQERDGLYELL